MLTSTKAWLKICCGSNFSLIVWKISCAEAWNLALIKDKAVGRKVKVSEEKKLRVRRGACLNNPFHEIRSLASNARNATNWCSCRCFLQPKSSQVNVTIQLSINFIFVSTQLLHEHSLFVMVFNWNNSTGERTQARSKSLLKNYAIAILNAGIQWQSN